MSSTAIITFEPDTVGVPADQWQIFCAEFELRYSTNTPGGNVYYYGGHGHVEVQYNEHRLVFSTYLRGLGGRGIQDVGRLAMTVWCHWGGTLSADLEIRRAATRPWRCADSPAL